jgi:hypothetical protein
MSVRSAVTDRKDASPPLWPAGSPMASINSLTRSGFPGKSFADRPDTPLEHSPDDNLLGFIDTWLGQVNWRMHEKESEKMEWYWWLAIGWAASGLLALALAFRDTPAMRENIGWAEVWPTILGPFWLMKKTSDWFRGTATR